MQSETKLLVDSTSCSIVKQYNTTELEPVKIKAYFSQMDNLRTTLVAKWKPAEVTQCILKCALLNFAHKQIVTHRKMIHEESKTSTYDFFDLNQEVKASYSPIGINYARIPTNAQYENQHC